MGNGKFKYSKPVVTRIKLDPEQAVLATCAEFGQTNPRVLYLASAGVKCWVTRPGTPAATRCTVALKGRRYTVVNRAATVEGASIPT